MAVLCYGRTTKTAQKAAEAFYAGREVKVGNTQVAYHPLEHFWGLYLHGNRIAYWYKSEPTKVYIQDCGWRTMLTAERLNSLKGVQVRLKGWTLNGKPWDGKRTLIEVSE